MWTLKRLYFDGPRFKPGMIFFKGGGAPKPKKQKVDLPKVPKPLPPPPPPVEFKPDVEQAQTDARTREARKRGIGATLLAGETGDTGGKRTLLG